MVHLAVRGSERRKDVALAASGVMLLSVLVVALCLPNYSLLTVVLSCAWLIVHAILKHDNATRYLAQDPAVADRS